MSQKQYLNAFINNSATIRATAKADITNAAHKAVTFDDEGNFILPKADGDPAMGILLSDPQATESDNKLITPAGTELDALIKDIGLAEAGAAIKAGEPVAAQADGTVKKAMSGNFILGFAVTAADTAGELVQIQITKSGYAG